MAPARASTGEPRTARSSSRQEPRRRRPLLTGALLLAAAAFLAYAPTLGAGFVWDDDYHVTRNPTLRDLDGLRRIWLDPSATPQYYPLTHTTFWIEYHLWGLRPAGYHAVNVALHALAAFLFARVLLRLGVPGAWLAAAIFALHPVHVESVAWITERKNVLSGSLYLGSLLAWLRVSGVVEPGSRGEQGGRRAAWLALLLYLGALLSKSVTSTLPVIVLLLVVWRRGTPRPALVALLAAAALAGIAMGLETVHLERHQIGAEGAEWSLGPLDRLVLAGRVPWFYLGKLLWPAGLSFVYPRWAIDASSPVAWIPLAAAAGGFAALWTARDRIGAGPLVGAAAFVTTLFPALGFFNVYPMRYSWVADHFQYLASLAPIALLTALSTRIATRWRPAVTPGRAVWARAAALVLLAGLGVTTAARCRAFHDEETLWRDTIARNPNAWMAHDNLAGILSERGALAEATREVREAVRLEPDRAGVRENLGRLLARQGRADEAAVELREAARLAPASPSPRVALGDLLAERGRDDDARRAYDDALRVAPDDGVANLRAGQLAARQRRLDDAIARLGRAVDALPALAAARFGLANALGRAGRTEEAITRYLEGLRLDAGDADAQYDVGTLLARAGRLDEAIAHLAEAVRLRPDMEDARRNLALAERLRREARAPAP